MEISILIVFLGSKMTMVKVTQDRLIWMMLVGKSHNYLKGSTLSKTQCLAVGAIKFNKLL